MQKLVSKGRYAKYQERKPKFYQFRQNNSGGSFDYDDDRGIAELVIVEAYNLPEAVATAKQIGLYFDGYGDCSCCGDRWSEPWRDEGDDVPSYYGTPLPESDEEPWYKVRQGKPYAYVHYLNGTIEGWG